MADDVLLMMTDERRRERVRGKDRGGCCGGKEVIGGTGLLKKIE
jgi:hypothetical protein